jgi:hypothetical protein
MEMARKIWVLPPEGIYTMVRLYTDSKLLGDTYVLGSANMKAFFILKVGAAGVTADGSKCIEEIDRAVFVKGCNDAVRTPFGVTGLENLSTGCLTVLNLLYIKENGLNIAVDVTGCGSNALNFAFEHADSGDIPLVLRHLDVSRCWHRSFLVNGEQRAKNMFELAAILEQYLHGELEGA